MNTTLLKHTATVSRMVKNGHATQRQNVATGVQCLIVPSDAQTASAANIELSRSYDVFFQAGQDVKTSDKLTIDGLDYYVKGRKNFRGVGNASHLQTICEISDVKED